MVNMLSSYNLNPSFANLGPEGSHFYRDGSCKARRLTVFFPPTLSTLLYPQTVPMNFDDLMNPKIVPLQKYTGRLTCPKKVSATCPYKSLFMLSSGH